MNLKFKVAARLTAAAFILLGSVTVAHAQTATLAWDANPEPEVAGYRVYVGTHPGTYGRRIDVGNVTTYTVTGLDLSLDYFFAVEAYASSGLSSALSDEVKLPAPVPPGTTVISSFRANAGFPLLVGKPVTWTAMASSRLGPVEYRFWLLGPSGWVVAKDYSPSNTFTWTPGWGDIGSHATQVWVRSIGSTSPYQAWVGTSLFSVNATSLQLTSNVEFPTPPGTPVTWTASAAGASGASLEYKFLLLNQNSSMWTVLRDWEASNQAVWTPGTPGNYVVQAWARRVGSGVNYDAWTGTGTLTIARSQLQVTSLTANKALPALTGTAITWTARSKGGTQGPIQYQFLRYSAGTGWQTLQSYSGSNTYTWTPTWGDEGDYTIQVWARSSGSTAKYEAWNGTNNFRINRAPIQLSTTTSFPVPPGTPVDWRAEMSDRTATFEYQFWVYSGATGTWSIAAPYSSSNTFRWTPATTGNYAVQVWARSVGSSATYETWRGTDYLNVMRTPATLKSLTSNVTFPSTAGTAITWTAIGSGGTQGPLLYQFWRYTEGTGWALGRDWSSANTYTWTPGAAGNYAVQVWVKGTGSTVNYESWLGTSTLRINP